MSSVPMISQDELAMVESNLLNEKQLNFLFKPTPKDHKYKRPAKGGGEWDYVTGVYVKKILNLMFGWDWSFEVVEYKVDIAVGQAFVLGKLTVNVKGRTITKMQFGRVDIKFKSEPVFDAQGKPVMVEGKNGQKYQKKQPSTNPLDVGNDLKAATTDALKKCAAELGIASDVYAPNEFKEIKVLPSETTDEEKKEIIHGLLDTDGIMITEEDRMNYERILEQEETESYSKAIKILTSKKPKK